MPISNILDVLPRETRLIAERAKRRNDLREFFTIINDSLDFLLERKSEAEKIKREEQKAADERAFQVSRDEANNAAAIDRMEKASQLKGIETAGEEILKGEQTRRDQEEIEQYRPQFDQAMQEQDPNKRASMLFALPDKARKAFGVKDIIDRDLKMMELQAKDGSKKELGPATQVLRERFMKKLEDPNTSEVEGTLMLSFLAGLEDGQANKHDLEILQEIQALHAEKKKPKPDRTPQSGEISKALNFLDENTPQEIVQQGVPKSTFFGVSIPFTGQQEITQDPSFVFSGLAPKGVYSFADSARVLMEGYHKLAAGDLPLDSAKTVQAFKDAYQELFGVPIEDVPPLPTRPAPADSITALFTGESNIGPDDEKSKMEAEAIRQETISVAQQLNSVVTQSKIAANATAWQAWLIDQGYSDSLAIDIVNLLIADPSVWRENSFLQKEQGSMSYAPTP